MGTVPCICATGGLSTGSDEAETVGWRLDRICRPYFFA